jgi:hypothetical protein
MAFTPIEFVREKWDPVFPKRQTTTIEWQFTGNQGANFHPKLRKNKEPVRSQSADLKPTVSLLPARLA